MTLPTPPSTIDLSPSPAYAAAIVAAHAAAGGAIAAVAGGAAAGPAAALVLLLGIVAARRAGLLKGARAPARLTLRSGAPADLELRNGERLAVVARRVGRRWVSLSAPERQRRSFFITRAMAGAASFRLVRLWALWGRLPASAGGRELNSQRNVCRTEA